MIKRALLDAFRLFYEQTGRKMVVVTLDEDAFCVLENEIGDMSPFGTDIDLDGVLIRLER